MKALVIHLGDIHLRTGANPCLEKFAPIVAAIQNEEYDLDAIVVVVAGDVAFSGKDAEYEIARASLDELRSLLSGRLRQADVRFVFVPGNHDCNFGGPDTVRKLVINSIRAGGTVDDEMVNCCCAVQSEFFNFRDIFANGEPNHIHSKLHWSYLVEVKGHRLLFNCFNTAWMSQRHEQQGGLHTPDIMFETNGVDGTGDYVVAVFHHPYNWMPPSTARSFRARIESSADLILTGHEHEPDNFKKYTPQGEVNEYLEGAVFQEQGKPDAAGFHAIYVDLERQMQRTLSFWWKDSCFEQENPGVQWVPYRRGSRAGREISLAEGMRKWLDDPGAGYQHPAKPDLALHDIYINPNLRPFEVKRNNEFVYSSIVEGRNLFKTLGGKARTLIFGRQQVGKTALAKILYRDFYEKNLTPVLINGEDLNKGHCKLQDLNALLERVFRNQYEAASTLTFSQIDRDKCVIIVDDFDHAVLNPKGRQAFVEVLKARCDRTVILGDDILKIEEFTTRHGSVDALVDFEQFDILQFGHLLRSHLISKWYSIGSEYDGDPSETARKIHQAEKLITRLLGKNYLPSYPVYVLAFIQAQDSTAQLNTAAGTYGSLYEVIITQALTTHSVVGNLDLRLTYLSELAFWMYSVRRRLFSDDEWEIFHRHHCEKFKIHPSRTEIKNEFLANGLLDFRDEAFGFRHTASYYYFVARYLRDNLSKNDVRSLVLSLLEKLYKEEHTSIWLFLTHLSKDPFLIESILAHSKRLYADLTPVKFEEDIGFMQSISTQTTRMRLNGKSLHEVKEEYLRRLDSLPEITEDEGNAYDSMDAAMDESLKMISTMNLALKTLEVLGQLVKNFTGSLQGSDKFELVSECYALGLRTTKMLFDMFQSDIENFIDVVVDRIIEKHPKIKSRDELKKKVQQFMFWLLETTGFSMLKRISQAVGHTQLSDTYRDVRAKNNTNATALVDISIRLDNVGLPEAEIEELARKFSGSIYCERLLQQLTIEHFYLFPISETTKQKICNLLKIEMRNVRALDASSRDEKLVARPS